MAISMLAIVLAGCGSGKGATAVAPTSTVATVPPNAQTDAAILAAYRAHWADINAVSTKYPVDATSAQLADHMAGPELTQVQAQLALLAAHDEYVVGPPVDSTLAKVKAQVGSAAVVSDCDLDTGITKNGMTGAVTSQAPKERTLVNARLDLIGGSWFVTQFSVVHAGCTTS